MGVPQQPGATVQAHLSQTQLYTVYRTYGMVTINITIYQEQLNLFFLGVNLIFVLEI